MDDFGPRDHEIGLSIWDPYPEISGFGPPDHQSEGLDADEPLDLVHAEGCLRQRPTASITALPQVNNSQQRAQRTTTSSGGLVMTPSETPNGSRIECLTPLLGPDLEVLQSWDPILAPRIPNCTAKGQYEGYSVLLSVAQTQR